MDLNPKGISMFKIAVGIVLLITSITYFVEGPASILADKKHPAEKKGIKSINEDVSTQITFSNKSGKTIKVYWLDFEGDRVHYKTLEDKESYDQQTFLTHPWLITDENNDAWYVISRMPNRGQSRSRIRIKAS
jgi:hypothetical protein